MISRLFALFFTLWISVQAYAGDPDPFIVLGVSKTATQEEVKSAYRKLAMGLHPDRNHEPGAEALLQVVNNAYDYFKKIWLGGGDHRENPERSSPRAAEPESAAEQARHPVTIEFQKYLRKRQLTSFVNVKHMALPFFRMFYRMDGEFIGLDEMMALAGMTYPPKIRDELWQVYLAEFAMTMSPIPTLHTNPIGDNTHLHAMFLKDFLGHSVGEGMGRFLISILERNRRRAARAKTPADRIDNLFLVKADLIYAREVMGLLPELCPRSAPRCLSEMFGVLIADANRESLKLTDTPTRKFLRLLLEEFIGVQSVAVQGSTLGLKLRRLHDDLSPGTAFDAIAKCINGLINR